MIDEQKNPTNNIIFPINGLIEKGDTGKIGTLSPEEGSNKKVEYLTHSEFQNRVKSKPILNERWSDGLIADISDIVPDANFTVTHAKVKTKEKKGAQGRWAHYICLVP